MPIGTWKQAYRLDQTAIVIGPKITVLKTSDELDWPDLNVSLMTRIGEEDYAPHARAISDLWLAMPLEQIELAPVIGGRERNLIIPANRPTVIAPETAWDSVRIRNDSPVLHAFLKRRILAEVANELFERDINSVEVLLKFAVEDRSMSMLLHSLNEALDEPAGYADLKVEHIARALAADVLRKHIAPPSEAPVAQYPLAATQANIVADYIREHLSSKILLKDLTALTGLSQTVFLPRFRASFGFSPHRYVMEMRVGLARKLLGKTNLPIAEIAVLCGFADQAHLTVTFKRIVGMMPTRYRRMIS